MARSYSERFLLSLAEADQTQIGVQLGRLCVEGNLPAAYVSAALGVSRMTIYSWFRGQDIRRQKRKTVEVMVDLMRDDFANGVLPARTRFDAKLYIETMIGGKIQ